MFLSNQYLEFGFHVVGYPKGCEIRWAWGWGGKPSYKMIRNGVNNWKRMSSS